jgi:hypothetical protein
MGKKNVPKSSSKKKATSKKKKTEDAKKTVSTKKTGKAAKKAAPAKTSKKAKKAPAKGKVKTKAKAKTKKKVTIKELLTKKFDVHKPDTFYTPEKPPEDRDYTAPPFYAAKDKADAERVRSLLMKQFDLSIPSEPPKAEEPKAKAPKKAKKAPANGKTKAKAKTKKKVTIKELLAKKFDVHKPDTYYTPVKAPEDRDYTAPPFYAAKDKADAERVRSLLMKQFDLSPPPEPPKAEEPKPEVKKATAASKPKSKSAPPPDYRTLIMKKFNRVVPEQYAVETATSKQDFTAPPFVSAETEKETKRIKALLFKSFDLQAPPEEPPAEKPADMEKITAAEDPERVSTESEPKVEVTYDKPQQNDMEESDPMDKFVKYAVAGFALIVLLIVVYSFANTSNFYIKPTKEGIQVLQGKFAPLGEGVLVNLPGLKPPAETKPVYTKTDVYPLIFNYYIGKADSLLEGGHFPNFDEIDAYAAKAVKYSLTKKQREAAYLRIDSLKGLIFQYRANVAIANGDLKAAKSHLSQAKFLATDEHQRAGIEQKIQSLSKPAAEAAPAKSGH